MEFVEAVRQNDTDKLEKLLSQIPYGVDRKDFINQLFPVYRSSLHVADETLLHIACQHGNYEMVCLLLQKGSMVNSTLKRGDTPLHLSVEHPDVCEVLLRQGADVNLVNDSKATPFHYLVRKQYDKSNTNRFNAICDLMVERGLDINCRNENDETPLHLACMTGQTDATRWLIENNCDLNAQNKKGYTPLHFATTTKHIDCVRLLAEAGADIRIRGPRGSAKEMAESENCREILSLLNEFERSEQFSDSDSDTESLLSPRSENSKMLSRAASTPALLLGEQPHEIPLTKYESALVVTSPPLESVLDPLVEVGDEFYLFSDDDDERNLVRGESGRPPIRVKSNDINSMVVSPPSRQNSILEDLEDLTSSSDPINSPEQNDETGTIPEIRISGHVRKGSSGSGLGSQVNRLLTRETSLEIPPSIPPDSGSSSGSSAVPVNSLQSFSESNVSKILSTAENNASASYSPIAISVDPLFPKSGGRLNLHMRNLSAPNVSSRRRRIAISSRVSLAKSSNNSLNGPCSIPSTMRMFRHINSLMIRNLTSPTNELFDCFFTIHHLNYDTTKLSHTPTTLRNYRSALSSSENSFETILGSHCVVHLPNTPVPDYSLSDDWDTIQHHIEMAHRPSPLAQTTTSSSSSATGVPPTPPEEGTPSSPPAAGSETKTQPMFIDNPPIYTSDVCRSTLNPTWDMLELLEVPVDLKLLNRFWLKVWSIKRSIEGSPTITNLMEVKIRMCRLNYIGDTLHTLSSLPSDALIFRLLDGCYAKDDVLVSLGNLKINDTEFGKRRTVASYSVKDMKRIVKHNKLLHTVRVQIATKLEQMEARINKQEQIAEKQKRIQLLRLKLENMKTETWKQKQLLMEEKRQVKEKRERVLRRIEEKGEATNNPIITLKANEKQLSIAKSDLADDLIRYTETRHRLDFILQKFVSRLRYLYPISTTSSNLYCIRNIELPNSKLFIKKESFGNVDLIAAALNFVAHALDLISRWHNIPLRYTMRIMGSHSSIRDDIRFTQTNDFPLYQRDAEAKLFGYGLYLLNNNLMQIFCSLGLTENIQLHDTLRNLVVILGANSRRQELPPS